jgi:MFS family permease
MYPMPRRPRGGQPVREALRWVVGRRDMALVFGMLVVVSTFAFNYSVSLPKLADVSWGGEEQFGWVLAVTSIGSLAGSLLTARLRRVPLAWMLSSTVVLGVGAIGMAWAPNVWVAFAWAIPLGVGGAGFITAANALSQQESPSDMRSRLMALQAVAFLGSTPIGGPITGFVADEVSAPWSLAYGGVISLACVVGAAAYLRVRPLEVGPDRLSAV